MQAFWSLPGIVLYAIFGAVGGLVGYGIARLIGLVFKSKYTERIATVVCVVAAIQVANVVVAQHKQPAEIDKAMADIKGQKVFATIFKAHPEAETQMRAEIAGIMAKDNAQQASADAQAASIRIVTKYVVLHMPTASDQAIKDLLVENADAVAMFKSNPEACVAYYLGKPLDDKAQAMMTAAFIDKEMSVKSEVIESSVDTPQPPPTDVSIDEISATLTKGYKAAGFNAEDMRQVSQIAQLPPQQGCQAALEFSTVLAAPPAHDASRLYKGMMAQGKT